MAERQQGQAGGVRHRRHRPAGQGRARRVLLRLDETEYAAIAEAAVRAGLTPTGYAAAAALAAAAGASPPGSPARQAFLELLAARTGLGRIGANLNQLAAAANAGQAPAVPQVRAVLDRVQAAAAAVESAAMDVRDRL